MQNKNENEKREREKRRNIANQAINTWHNLIPERRRGRFHDTTPSPPPPLPPPAAVVLVVVVVVSKCGKNYLRRLLITRPRKISAKQTHLICLTSYENYTACSGRKERKKEKIKDWTFLSFYVACFRLDNRGKSRVYCYRCCYCY